MPRGVLLPFPLGEGPPDARGVALRDPSVAPSVAKLGVGALVEKGLGGKAQGISLLVQRSGGKGGAGGKGSGP